MSCSKIVSKRKFGFVTLTMLGTFTCSQALLAMDEVIYTLVDNTGKISQKKFSEKTFPEVQNLSGYYVCDEKYGQGYSKIDGVRSEALALLKTHLDDSAVQRGIKAVMQNYYKSLIRKSQQNPEERKSDYPYTQSLENMGNSLKWTQKNGNGIPLVDECLKAIAKIRRISLTLYEEVGDPKDKLCKLISHSNKNYPEHRHALRKLSGHYSLLNPQDIKEKDEIPTDSAVVSSLDIPSVNRSNEALITITPMETEEGEETNSFTEDATDAVSIGTKKRHIPTPELPPAKRLKSTSSQNIPVTHEGETLQQEIPNPTKTNNQDSVWPFLAMNEKQAFSVPQNMCVSSPDLAQNRSAPFTREVEEMEGRNKFAKVEGLQDLETGFMSITRFKLEEQWFDCRSLEAYLNEPLKSLIPNLKQLCEGYWKAIKDQHFDHSRSLTFQFRFWKLFLFSSESKFSDIKKWISRLSEDIKPVLDAMNIGEAQKNNELSKKMVRTVHRFYNKGYKKLVSSQRSIPEDSIYKKITSVKQKNPEQLSQAPYTSEYPDYSCNIVTPGYTMVTPSYNIGNPGYNMMNPGYNMVTPSYPIGNPGYTMGYPGCNTQYPAFLTPTTDETMGEEPEQIKTPDNLYIPSNETKGGTISEDNDPENAIANWLT